MRSTVKAFTLIEVLVVVSIIGILMSLTLIGIQGSRQSTRDTKRKSDLELVRSGLELYKSDCKSYPNSTETTSPGYNLFTKTSLIGDGDLVSCAVANKYINEIPKDPHDPARTYVYWSDGVTYEICAGLEKGGTGVTCGPTATCGGTNTCNFKVINP